MALGRLVRQLTTRMRRRQFDRDLAEEMRLHVELRARRNMERGIEPMAAVCDARRTFGGIAQIHEASRDALGWRWLDDLGRSLRGAGRAIRRRPIFAAAIVTTLALAIGANVAVFTVMDQVVLHPLAVPDPGALVTVQRTYDARGVRRQQTGISWDEAEKLRAIDGESVALSSAVNDRGTRRMPIQTPDGTTVDVDGRFVSGNYFQVFGVAPSLGPGIGAANDTPGAAPVVMLDYRFWRTRFAADPEVLGRALWINGVAATIVGVAPAAFTGATLGVDPPAIYLPLMTASRLANGSDVQTDRYGRHFTGPAATGGGAFVPSPVSPLASLNAVGRLSRGHDVARIKQTLAAFSTSGWDVAPLTATMLPVDAQRDVRQFLGLVAVAVGLTFLIGCANVAGLLMARGDERRAELAVRAALGAGRSRLIVDLATEAAVLIGAGAAAAFLVAKAILASLSAYVLPGNIAVSTLPAGFTARAWLVACVSVVLAAGFVALWPAVRSTRGAIVQDVSRRSSVRLGGSRLLVGVQVTMCVVLVFGAALFVRTMSNALSIDVGFDARDLASAELGISAAVRRNPEAGAAQIDALDRLADAARAVPGVTAATAGELPLVVSADGSRDALNADGASVPLPAPIDVVYASADYFTTLRQRLVAGRDFTAADRTDSRPVAILNEAAARQGFSGRDSVGHEIALGRTLGGQIRMDVPRLVVGVVRDARLATLRDSGKPVVYLSRAQNKSYLAGYAAGSGTSSLIVRSTRSLSDLRAALAGPAGAAGFELRGFTSLHDKVDDILMPQRLGRLVLGALGLLALTLTVVGVYGLVSCLVARSTKEIGVRMALGAGGGQIAKGIAVWACRPLLCGLAAGVLLSRLGGHAADRFMYGMTGADLSTLALVILAILVSAAAAAIPPVRSAIRIDPIVTLREE